MGLENFAWTHAASEFGQLFGNGGEAPPHLSILILVLALSVVGIVYLIRSKRPAALAYLLVPAAFSLGATVFQHYLFGEVRFNLFYLHFIFIFMAAGVYAIAWQVRPRAAVAVCIVASLLAPLVSYAWTGFDYGHPQEDMRSVIEWYGDRVGRNDYTFVSKPSDGAFSFYYLSKHPELSFNAKKGRLFLVRNVSKPEDLASHWIQTRFARAKGHTVWLIMSHFEGSSLQVIQPALELICPIEDSYESTRAAIYQLRC
jgi:hypothetical protein